jgi:hypothetical protein
MGESNALTAALLSKLEEQIELASRLITLIPADELEYKPLPDSLRVCDLLGHLLECLAGFCASLYAVKPDRLAHFGSLRELRVNHCCGIEEARHRIGDYSSHIREGFGLLRDDDLVQRVPTIFVPEGEALMTVLLGNLEHLINHKHQLFFYLKLLGVPVTTRDLYRIREIAD